MTGANCRRAKQHIKRGAPLKGTPRSLSCFQSAVRLSAATLILPQYPTTN
nr:MAG TPA: hypothetical protein [Inoviridae sp.]